MPNTVNCTTCGADYDPNLKPMPIDDPKLEHAKITAFTTCTVCGESNVPAIIKLTTATPTNEATHD